MSDRHEFHIDVGSHRTRAIRSFLSQLDQITGPDGFVRPLHEEVREIDEDHDSGTDASLEQASDSSDTDSGLRDGSTEDQGESTPRTLGLRESSDEGTAEGADLTPVETSEPGELEATDERDATESEQSPSQQGQSRSVFGAFQHI